MVPVVQSQTTIGDSTAVTPGAVVGDWAGIDPWSIAGVAIAGAILLLVGARLLKPALVLSMSMIGAILGLELAGATEDGTLPELVRAIGVPPLAWVVSLPLAFGLVAAMLGRLALAVLLGAAVSCAVLLVGLAIATGGRAAEVVIDPPPTATVDAGPAASSSLADRMRDAVIEGVTQEAIEELADQVAVPDLDRVGSLLPAELGKRWRAATAGVPSGTVNLIVAIAMVFGICAGMFAVLLPERTAIVATSISGGWLVSGAAMAAWGRWMPESTPPTVFITLLAWGVLAALGVLHQSRRPKHARDRARDRD